MADVLAVSLEIEGDATYEPLLETSAYRAVQEARPTLSSTRRAHTCGCRCVGSSRWSWSCATRVRTHPAGAVGPLAGSGLGIEGIRARAELHAGGVDAGPMTDGGWQVEAVFGGAASETDAGDEDRERPDA